MRLSEVREEFHQHDPVVLGQRRQTTNLHVRTTERMNTARGRQPHVIYFVSNLSRKIITAAGRIDSLLEFASYLYFGKALDKVQLERLVLQLKAHGIRGNVDTKLDR